jgi:hypothetical protein
MHEQRRSLLLENILKDVLSTKAIPTYTHALKPNQNGEPAVMLAEIAIKMRHLSRSNFRSPS